METLANSSELSEIFEGSVTNTSAPLETLGNSSALLEILEGSETNHSPVASISLPVYKLRRRERGRRGRIRRERVERGRRR
jgi:hypothetical protein